MTIRQTLEDNLVEYLQSCFDIPVFAIGKRINEELEDEASKNPKGAMFVMYVSSSREKKGNMYEKKIKYLILIFNKNRREKDGIYDLIEILEEKLYGYKYKSLSTELGEDSISYQATVKGFWLGEFEIKFNLIYPIQYI